MHQNVPNSILNFKNSPEPSITNSSNFRPLEGKGRTERKRTSMKRTMDPGVRATVVTAAGHCTHAKLTSGHALAVCYSCCVHSHGLC